MKFTKKILYIFIFLVIICISNKSMAMSDYQTVETKTGIVLASALNVREGPGTKYDRITIIYKSEYVRIFAQIGDWFVIQTDNDYVGLVNREYIKLIYEQDSSQSTSNQENVDNNLTTDEQEVFNLVNEQRTIVGLAKLEIDEELQNVARLKVKDMVDNNYFDHNSPTYGTPFNMIKNFGITYKAAGENIAGNSSNQGAVDAWMASEGHKDNILSNNYNYTGIAVVNSPKYGKIYVQMFIGK